MQLSNPMVAANLPAAQSEHVSSHAAVAVNFLNWPLAHCKQLPPVDPPQLERYRPEPHGLHAMQEVCPRFVWYRPASQAVHDTAPAEEKVPVAHLLHVVLHDVPAFVLYVPAAQDVHLPEELAPQSVRYEPPAHVLQSTHVVWPVVS